MLFVIYTHYIELLHLLGLDMTVSIRCRAVCFKKQHKGSTAVFVLCLKASQVIEDKNHSFFMWQFNLLVLLMVLDQH
jgi:hypothetical protein